MSLKKESNIFRTFAFRLAIWHTVLFAIFLIIIFSISYKILVSSLRHTVDRALLSETTEIEEELGNVGIENVKLDIQEGIKGEGSRWNFYRLLNSDLTSVFVSDLGKWKFLNYPELDKLVVMSLGKNIVYRTIRVPDKKNKVRIITRSIYNGKYIIQIGKIARDDEQIVEHYSKAFGFIVVFLLLCNIILSWLEACRAMSGVKRITQTALNIGRDGLKHRVHLENEGEEIDELAEAFNTMLGRIEQLMLGLKEVTNNIAHDLRTPITRIRGMAESTLHNASDINHYQEVVGMVVEECDRLNHLINTMLEIAEADAGIKKFNYELIDVTTIVQKGCEIFLLVAQDKNISLEFNGLDQPLNVLAEASRLQRVISNLLDNAVKFTEPGGSIVVEVKENGLDVDILVKDTGIGIDEHQMRHIFEKFYRAESSRSTPGNGLGLSFAKSMIASMGGTIIVESKLLQGASFLVRLPLKRF